MKTYLDLIPAVVNYPDWICADCGQKYGRIKNTVQTYHEDLCGWCGDTKSCTEPRDWSYPDCVTQKVRGEK